MTVKDTVDTETEKCGVQELRTAPPTLEGPFKLPHRIIPETHRITNKTNKQQNESVRSRKQDVPARQRFGKLPPGGGTGCQGLPNGRHDPTADRELLGALAASAGSAGVAL